MLNPVKLHCKFTVRGTGPDIFKLVHYEAHAVGKRTVCILLECSLLDAADAHTRISSNKTYLATDESTFMLERRKQEQRHFLDQSVFIFEVKVYKLVRWCNIAYNILRSYLYSYWKVNNLSDKMLFHCGSLLVLVFVTTSHGYYQEMGRRASSVGK